MGCATLAGIGLQSSLGFRWVVLPLLARALGPAQLRIDAGRFELPARLQLAGLRVVGAGDAFEIRATQLRLALDLWGSQRSGRWIVDELTVEGLEVDLVEAEPEPEIESGERRQSSFDPFAVDVRRIDLLDVRVARTTVSGARTTLGPGTLSLRDGVRGADPSGRLSAPVRIAGDDGVGYDGQIELALHGALAPDAPHLAWEGSVSLRLGSVGPKSSPDSALELAGELRGQLGRSMPTIITADLRGQQAGREAGRVEGTFARSATREGSVSEDTAQITAALVFTDVSASLLNPVLASMGIDPFETGLVAGDVKWDSSPLSDKLSSRVDVRDLRVRHATGLLGPFLLHSAQSATWDARSRELSMDQFELDLVLAGVSRVRGRLDRPLILFAPSGGLSPVGTSPSEPERAPARVEIVVQSLPLNEIAALGVPILPSLWTGVLTGRAMLGVLEVKGTGDYALDFTLAMPPSKQASIPALRSRSEARLELTGRADAGKSIDIERLQLGLRSGRDPLLKLNGSGRYAVATRRMELNGSVESGNLASKSLWGPLPLEWARELSVDAIRGSWNLALDSERAVLRSDPRLLRLKAGPSARPGARHLDDVRLGLVLEVPRRAPVRIQELRMRAPEFGSDAELSLTGEADLSASPPAFDLDLAWKAVSVAGLRASRLLSDVPWVEPWSAGVLDGELSVEIEKEARIGGTVRLDAARVRVRDREVGPLASSVAFGLLTSAGKPSELTADVACQSDAGALLRFAVRWPEQSGGPSVYSVDIGVLDLGRVQTLFDAGAPRPGPVLSGDLRVSTQADALPFSFELASAAPGTDRVRGEGRLTGAAQPTSARRVEARVNVERVTLDPYLELLDVLDERGTPASAPAPDRSATRDGPEVEIRIDGVVGELAWRTVVFEEGSFAWTRDREGSRLELRPQRALGGELTGQAVLTAPGAARPRLRWELDGDSLRAELLLRALDETDDGALRGKMRVQTQGELQLGAGPHQASGATTVEITDGQLGSSRLIEFIATQTRISALRRMRFDRLAGDLRLDGDILQVVGVEVRSPVVGLAMTGTVDLSGQLDLRVLSRVGPGLKQLLSVSEYSQIVGGTLDRFLTLPVVVLVGGTPATPSFSVRPTTASVTTAVWDTMSETGKLLRRGTDIFKGKDQTPTP